MKAIQTQYKGYRFRSRLEARYAVLFDSLGMRWSYEPEGFELGDGKRYLPDFWIEIPGKEGWGYWIEIKPVAPGPEELAKLHAVCKSTKHRGWFLIGTPGDGLAMAEESHRFSDFMHCAPVAMCTTGTFNITRLERAIDAARSARFEFGESGARA